MPRKTTLLTAAVLALGLASAGEAAAAGRLTGQQLLGLCTANMNGRGNPMAAAECMGFVVGVADTFSCVEDVAGYRWKPTAQVSQPQLVRIVVLRIRSDSGALSGAAHLAVAKALSSEFPCAPEADGN